MKDGEVYEAMLQLDAALRRWDLGHLRGITVSERAFEAIVNTETPRVRGKVERLVVALDGGPCAVVVGPEPEWVP